MSYGVEAGTIQGLPGVLVYLGLGHPLQRAVTVGAVVAGIQYVTKKPDGAFDEMGSIRPHRMFSVSPGATDTHFLIYPVAIATAVFLFT